MKRKAFLSVVTIAVLLAVGFAGLHVYLANDFSSAIQKYAVPELKKRLGTDVSVGRARANMLAGSLAVADIRVANPAGFEEASFLSIREMDLDVGLAGLFWRIVKVAEARVADADAMIVRNKEGDVNLFLLKEEVDKHVGKPPKGETPAPEEKPAEKEPPPASSRPLPRLLVEKSSVRTSLAYVDHALSEKVFRMTLAVTVEAENLSTYELPGGEWGTVRIRGHLTENPESFVMDLNGRVGPVSDLNRPSFDLSGDVGAIDISKMDWFAKNLEFTGDSAAMQVELVCRDGVFDGKRSRLVVQIRNAKPAGKLGKKLRYIPLPKDPSFVIPVRGALRKPEVSWTGAVVQSLMQNAGSALKSLEEDPKVQEDVGKVLGGLGELLLKKPKKEDK